MLSRGIAIEKINLVCVNENADAVESADLGLHNKMEMISRRAFGFRNFNNYRMRVLALCGWNGVINRKRKLVRT
jgi:hypothetical protein